MGTSRRVRLRSPLRSRPARSKAARRVTLFVKSLDGRRGPARSLLLSAVGAAVEGLHCRRVCVEVAYANDGIMRRLNSSYGRSRRKRAGAACLSATGSKSSGCTTTDVLAFPAHQPLPGGYYLLGEVVVNRDAARRNSASEGITIELLRYVVHGVLHMVGYDDATAELRSIMWRRQEEIIANLCQEGNQAASVRNQRTEKKPGRPRTGLAAALRRYS